ncbi:MAG: DUF2314 domain-containing protein [Dehalococcoidia bacterium]|jgi:uncharacterized protein YegJ (DUF2314 family)
MSIWKKSSNNVIPMCPECSEKMYPHKGKFKAEDIRIGDSIKKRFAEDGAAPEHMWVIVTSIAGDKLVGTLDNDPVGMTSIKYGDRVELDITEVEDIVLY